MQVFHIAQQHPNSCCVPKSLCYLSTSEQQGSNTGHASSDGIKLAG